MSPLRTIWWFSISLTPTFLILGFPGSSAGKESACNAGDPSSIPGLGRSPGEGKGYPLQYSGLEYSMNSPWNSPGQNTEVGSLFLLQGIFPTQGLNPGLPHCRRMLYELSHKGSPRRHEVVANTTTLMNPENPLSERYRRVHTI